MSTIEEAFHREVLENQKRFTGISMCSVCNSKTFKYNGSIGPTVLQLMFRLFGKNNKAKENQFFNKFTEISKTISWVEQDYTLVSAIYWNGSHFRTFSLINGNIYWYDGMGSNLGKSQLYAPNTFPIHQGPYIIVRCFYLIEANDYLQQKESIFSNIVKYTLDEAKVDLVSDDDDDDDDVVEFLFETKHNTSTNTKDTSSLLDDNITVSNNIKVSL